MHRGAQQAGVLLGLAIAGALGWYHAGPYRWLADVQLRAIHRYYVFPTWLVLGMLIGLPLGALASTVATSLSVRDHSSPALDRFVARYKWLVWTRGGQLVVFGFCLAVLGGFGALRALSAGELTALSVLALERGELPESGWVRLVDGVVDDERTIEVDHFTYVPVFGERENAMVFLQIGPASHGVTDRGLLVENGLPNLARVAFDDAQLLAPHHYVIEAGKDPAGEARSLGYLVLLGLALFGIGFTIRVVTSARGS